MNLQRGGRLVATLTIVGITPSADQSLRDYLLDIGIQIEPIRQEQPATGCVVVDGVVTGNLDYAIPQGAWARDVLDPLQYTNTLLIEVPLTRKSAGTPQLEVALQRFKEAQDARIAGDDRGAVAKCREAFDA